MYLLFELCFKVDVFLSIVTVIFNFLEENDNIQECCIEYCTMGLGYNIEGVNV